MADATETHATLSPVVDPNPKKSWIPLALMGIGAIALLVMVNREPDAVQVNDFEALDSQELGSSDPTPDFQALAEQQQRPAPDEVEPPPGNPARPSNSIQTPVVTQPEISIYEAIQAQQRQRSEATQLALQEQQRREQSRRTSGIVFAGNNPSSAQSRNSLSEIRQEASDRIRRLTEGLENSFQQAANGSGSALQGVSAEEGESPDRSASTVLKAQWIDNRRSKLLQGDIIPAILDSQLDTALSGLIRAIVVNDVYSESGDALVIARGAKLIGQYQQANAQEGRVLVVWTRLIDPAGFSIELSAPATDGLGATGVSGETDSRFLERFGASTLLSIIGGFAQNQADDNTESSQLGSDFNSAASVALQNSVNLRPIIRVDRGSAINVLINEDIDFSDVLAMRERINHAN